MENSHNKPIIESTSPDVDLTAPHFNKQAFDDAVYEHGYDATIERAIKCPCRIEANNNGLTSCINCGGSGWIFVNKRMTIVVSQSMNINTKNKTWTEEDRGTVSISARPEDRFGFMDRITILNLESIYSEVLRVKKVRGKYISSFIYKPNSVEFLYLYVDDKEKLLPLKRGIDYTISEDLITISEETYSKGKKDNGKVSISVRYLHNPQYHVIDIPRERVADAKATGVGVGCPPLNPDSKSQIPQLVINAIARKAQYSIDKPNLVGLGLVDNSYIDDISISVDNCELVNSRITFLDKINCLLPTFDFSNSIVIEKLTSKQITDLKIGIVISNDLDYFFGLDDSLDHKIQSGEEGKYSTTSFSGGVQSATYFLNGNQVTLPINTNIGDSLKIVVSRNSVSNNDSVKFHK